MESLAKNPVFEYPPETLEKIRKCWSVDKPGQMQEAVAVLSKWAKAQPHFLRNDFDQKFLENTIISAKGSIERAKARLDKYCTVKTLSPKNFLKFDYIKEIHECRSFIDIGFLPKYNSEYHRVILIRYNRVIDSETIYKIYKYVIILMEYLKVHDYYNSATVIADHRLIDLVQLLKNVNFIEFREYLVNLMEAYAIRFGGVHLLTESKVIESIVTLLKQILKPSVARRIKVHRNEKTMYEHIDKEILPVEYGGQEKSLKEMHDDLYKVVASTDFEQYLEITREFGTNEKLRPTDQFNESYIGMPGTFRTLSVD